MGPMVVKASPRRAIHVVPDGRNTTLCGIAMSTPNAVRVLMPWDDPLACHACVEARKKKQLTDQKRKPDTYAPQPYLF
jgi:hypothetical protein